MPRRSVLRGAGALAAGLAGLLGCSRPATRAPGAPEPVRVAYGEHRDQHAELHLPAGDGPVPVVVVVHGGYWRQRYGADLGAPLAADLAGAGLAAWNLEYRRVGGAGGWPATLLDVAAGVDALAGPGQDAATGRLDLARVVTLGHSAGGQLAVWAAARHRLTAGAPGAGPAVRPLGAVSQAGVLDLVDGARHGLGGGAVADLLGGGPDEVPDRYAVASPAALAPLGVPVVCVHGEGDDVVPLRQSERYAAADPGARLVVVPGGHFEVIDPSTPAWAACRSAVEGLVHRPGNG